MLRRAVMNLRRRFSQNRGQALLESAFILPIVLFLLFGIIEGGLIVGGLSSAGYWTNIAARDTAEDAAAATKGDPRALAAINRSLLGTTRLFEVDEVDVEHVNPDGTGVGWGPWGWGAEISRYRLDGGRIPPQWWLERPWDNRDANPASPQFARVTVKYHYRFKAGILGKQLDFTSSFVSRLQPTRDNQAVTDIAPPLDIARQQFGLLRHANCQANLPAAPVSGFVYARRETHGGLTELYLEIKVRATEQGLGPPDAQAGRLQNQKYRVYLYPSCDPKRNNPVLAGTNDDATVLTDGEGNGDATIRIPKVQEVAFPEMFGPPIPLIRPLGTFTVEPAA